MERKSRIRSVSVPSVNKVFIVHRNLQHTWIHTLGLVHMCAAHVGKHLVTGATWCLMNGSTQVNVNTIIQSTKHNIKWASIIVNHFTKGAKSTFRGMVLKINIFTARFIYEWKNFQNQHHISLNWTQKSANTLIYPFCVISKGYRCPDHNPK